MIGQIRDNMDFLILRYLKKRSCVSEELTRVDSEQSSGNGMIEVSFVDCRKFYISSPLLVLY